MATRTVRILYTAVAGPFIAQTKAAAAAAGGLATTSAAAGTGLAGVGASARNAVAGLGLFNPKLLGAAGVVVGLKSAASAAVDFEREATKLQTQIGLSADAADELSDAARRIGVETGIGAQAAVEASFFIASAGLRGQVAMEALEFSAQAARVGLGETSVVADLLTSAMNAYGHEVLGAEHATDILLAAVREGKAEAPQFAGALGAVLPIAAEMGITFDQVAGATAAMTRTGTDAATASTQLRSIMASLIRPSQGAEQAMAEFGLSAEGVRRQIREEGLFEALVSMREAIGDNDEGLARIFPNIRAFVGVLDLTGASVEANAATMDALADSAGGLSDALEIVGDTGADAAARFSAAWQEVRLEIGNTVMPALASSMEFLSRALQNQDDSLQDTLRRMDPFTVALGALGDHTQHANGAVNHLVRALRLLEVGTDDATGSASALTDDGLDYLLKRGVEPAEDGLDDLASALGLTREEMDELTGATGDATDALAEYNDMVKAAFDPVFRLNRAVNDVEKAQRDFNDAVNEYGRESAEAREAAFDLTSALFELESASRDGDLSFQDLNGQLDRFVREGKLTVDQADIIRGRIEELTESAENYSGDYRAELQVGFDEDLLLQASAAIDNAARPREVVFNIREVTPTGFTAGPVTGPFAGRVDGGRVSAGTPYVVGEHGRELFVPDRSGTIMSRAETQNVGSGKTYQLSVNTVRSDVNVMEQFRRMELLDV